MPTTYTPNAANNPATYTLPSDLDNASAESVNVAFRALADKAAHAASVFAQLGTANTFTGQQTINDTNGFLEIAGSARWKLMVSGHCGVTDGSQEGEVRYYANDPTLGDPYYGAITCNAYWTGSIWRQQADTVGSTAILFRSTGFDFGYKGPGSSDWSSWPQGTGTINALAILANSHLFSSAKTRTMELTPANKVGGTIVDTFTGSLLNDGGYAWFRLQLPLGAVITRIDIKHYQNTSSADAFVVVSKDVKWSAATTTPTLSDGATATVDTSTGWKISSITTSSSINLLNEKFLVWRPVDNANLFAAAKVTWTDVGPEREY
jgi:hypothetical protein